MSLIEEALRKHREESQPAAASSEPPPPPLPPTLPPASPVQEKEVRGRKPWLLLVLILVFTLVAVGGGGWFAFQGVRMWAARKAGTLTPEIQTPPAAEDTSTEPESEQPPPPPSPDEAAGLDDMPAVAQADSPPVAVGIESAAPTSLPAPVVTTPAATVQPAAHPVRPAPAKHREPVIWPALSVSGIIGSGKQNGIAIINKQMINVGDSIEGVKVVGVGRQSVQLSYEGESRVLKVGDSTN